MMDLSKLSFGAPAAERDDDLQSYFLASESYRRLKDGSKTIVLGNRGAGKSALFRMLREEKEASGTTVVSLAPEDYSYELLRDALAREAEGAWAKQGSYSAAWKFLIYVIVMKKLVAGRGLRSGPASKIYSYIRDKHSNFDLNPIGTLISYLKRLEGIKVGNLEASLKTRELQKLYKLEEITHLLEPLERLCARRPVIVLVDELDKGWDASEDAVAFVAGLFQAAVSINARGSGLRVLVSLRKELYENIPSLYEDAQKVRDIIEDIEWDEERLFELICLRIRHAMGGTKDPDELLWNSIFAETLDYRRNRSFNYMIDRTLYRPREIIQFCTDAVSEAVRMHERAPVNYNVISRAELGYSESRLQDIASEYRFQFPGLLGVFETFRGLPFNMSRQTLEEHCLRIALADLKVSSDASWVEDCEPDKMIEYLWRVGFLRARAVGGLKARRRSGSEYLGSHQISNLNLLHLQNFHVHPMFRSFLGMKETKTK